MKQIQFIDLLRIALAAGKEILDVYAQDFDVEYKKDDSPLTEADWRAHRVIMEGLQSIDPAIPILSEEGRDIPYAERKHWSRFWLVDPLDGTKEFIKKNGEFTVNIALIEGKYPSLGVIYAPALDVFYFGRCSKEAGHIVEAGHAGQDGHTAKVAYKLEHASKVKVGSEEELIQKSERLQVHRHGSNGTDLQGRSPERSPERSQGLTKNTESDVIKIVASRSHMSAETEAFVQQLEEKYGKKAEVVSSGSSLKFCLVAEGRAEFYPRYAPTMEWDTGAGQAIVEAAGGSVTRYEDGERFYYNREHLLNGWFLVSASTT